MAFLGLPLVLAALATAPLTSTGAGVGADEAILAPAFDGTIVSTYPDGRVSKLWLNRDGTFSAAGPGAKRQGGRWRIKAHNVCLSQLKPVPIPFLSYCAPIPQSGVANAWSGKAVTGEPIVIRFVADRAHAPTD